jgi:DNA-binding transcriptional LysR family regulator
VVNQVGLMLIDNINLNLLRLFEAVYRTGSMTRAADELHMTQSGVSQNIKSLEDVLGIKLFDRIKQRPLPTQEAHHLFEKFSPFLREIEQTLNQISHKDRVLRGVVKLGLPIEFGNNVILPLLASWGRMHPEVSYLIRYDIAPRMNQDLLKGELDFAIVDDFAFDPQINVTPVSHEVLTLCSSVDYLKGKNLDKMDKKFFETLDYIDYSAEAPIVEMWFRHHYRFSNFRPRIKAHLMDVQGMARMIREGMGLGILPLHVLKKERELKMQLHLFEGRGEPLLNHMSLAYLKNKTQSLLVQETLKHLTEGLAKRIP